MLGSALVRDPKFHDRVVAETRALLVDDSKINGQAWAPLGLVLRSLRVVSEARRAVRPHEHGVIARFRYNYLK